MKQVLAVMLVLNFLFVQCFAANSNQARSKSVFQTQLNDSAAVYFTPFNFKISTDGKTDVSDALQQAISTLKSTRDCGVVFLPEGKYRISKTIYIPSGIRLIGYGKNRPEIILGKNTPGYQQPDPSGNPRYLFWFVGSYNSLRKQISDANAGTFYSAFSNIDLRIEDGNPQAVALRTHYAQHCFISHVDIHIGHGYAGIHEVGNEIEDVRFFGGEYGICATKTSPGWQYVMIDTYFENQRKAAIRTQEAGLTITRMSVKNVPVVIDINPDKYEKLFMQDCRLENVFKSVLVVSKENHPFNQINVRNTDCCKAPVFATFRQSGKQIPGAGVIYEVKSLTSGFQVDRLGAEPTLQTTREMIVLKSFPKPTPSDIPAFQSTAAWVNIKSLGAKGDGKTDDYSIIQAAIDKYETIYFPDGWYKVSETIKLKSNTALIGLHPITTQLMLENNTPAFAGFGSPKALLETSVGGRNIVNGIGLNTNAENPRAVGCKWMAGAASYMNDVKFVGGHGNMSNTPRGLSREMGGDGLPTSMAGDQNNWDSQYWSLWVTNGGGGTFKDIWTAHTASASGFYVSNTSTKAQVYLLSAEHHVRNEIRMKNVSNWQLHAIQLEEEGVESRDCLPLEIEDCSNLQFTNLFMYRVTRVTNPMPYGIRTTNSKDVEFLNIHNYSQLKFAFDHSLYDMTIQTAVRSRELARLFLKSEPTQGKSDIENQNQVRKLATGFEYANGLCRDSKGNVFFCDSRRKRIYKWSAQTDRISMVTDVPWEPLSLGCDKNDQLVVLFKYYPRKGYTYTGKPELTGNSVDAGTSYGGWGITRFGVLAYAIDPDKPEDSIRLLEKQSIGSIGNIFKALYPVYLRNFTSNYIKECYVAPDGMTVVPICDEMSRSCAMIEAFPGNFVYCVDDNEKSTLKCRISPDGKITEARPFAETGEYGLAESINGNVYIAADEIRIFGASGQQTGQIKVPERPTNICFGGKDGKTLFIAAGTSLYAIDLKN
jgi:Gluconolactonase